MWLANEAVMMRRPTCWVNTACSTAPTAVSLGAYPFSSALVESHMQQPDPVDGGEGADAGEVGDAPVDRGEVELEVARVQDHALRRVERDGEGVGAPSG